MNKINTKLFDHTILAADATEEEVAKVCAEAVEHGFMTVCVNSFYVNFANEKLMGSDVKVCAVVGFPLGKMMTAAKCSEARLAIKYGASEIDMVINIGALKGKRYSIVHDDIKQVKKTCGRNIILKVIIETCLLTDEEKRIACRLAEEAGADFVKTSTGFSTGGATETDILLMHDEIGDRMGIKASGGIRTREDAEKMLAAGATRLGTSRTVEIVS
ncbi:MAG: deoxyribose-phosphate aldolase [Lachnospiraceae bacterium]|nr:deoxyribose-phosphate aldolase [Lachnospiraceae bacterium]